MAEETGVDAEPEQEELSPNSQQPSGERVEEQPAEQPEPGGRTLSLEHPSLFMFSQSFVSTVIVTVSIMLPGKKRRRKKGTLGSPEQASDINSLPFEKGNYIVQN